MPVAKIHLSLNVADVDLATVWYEAFFGVPAHKRRPGYANFDLESPPLKLALNQIGAGIGGPPDPNQDGSLTHLRLGSEGPLNHLGILVPSTGEVNAAKTRLEDAGLITFSEENVTCCYALQDKIWVRDPDGNAWEVYALVDELDDGHDHAHEATAVSACCTPNAQPAREACRAPGCRA